MYQNYVGLFCLSFYFKNDSYFYIFRICKYDFCIFKITFSSHNFIFYFIRFFFYLIIPQRHKWKHLCWNVYLLFAQTQSKLNACLRLSWLFISIKENWILTLDISIETLVYFTIGVCINNTVHTLNKMHKIKRIRFFFKDSNIFFQFSYQRTIKETIQVRCLNASDER